MKPSISPFKKLDPPPEAEVVEETPTVVTDTPDASGESVPAPVPEPEPEPEPGGAGPGEEPSGTPKPTPDGGEPAAPGDAGVLDGDTFSIDDVFPGLESALMGRTITVTDIFVYDLYDDSRTLSTFTLNEDGSRYYVNIEFKDDDAYMTATMLLDFVDTLTVCGTVGQYCITNA